MKAQRMVLEDLKAVQVHVEVLAEKFAAVEPGLQCWTQEIVLEKRSLMMISKRAC